MPVALTSSGLSVDGRPVPVYSGSVHYWRLERDRWPRILDQVQALGFGMVETYVPWSVHEVAPGLFDWGEDDPRKDIEAFVALCAARGLWLMVRPGPLINAEMTDFGFPEWVLMDPAVQARSASGSLHLDAAWGLHPPHQFPVLSYASEAFYAAVGGWFDAICPIIARHLAPAGPIVAVQSDNETCYDFHDAPYATDYAADAIALYRRFLADRYGGIGALNAAYGTRHAGFDDVEPPRDMGVAAAADLAWHIDWVASKEHQIRWAVSRFAGMLRARGVDGVPIFHDIAYQHSTPLDATRLEAAPDVDWVGMNMYANKEDYATAARRIRFLAGATRLPFVPEFGCGLWSHHQRTFEPEEHEFITLAALMHGLKAINFYMLVERERWQGSPITRHGEHRPNYAPFFAKLSDFLTRFPVWEFERVREVLLLRNYDLHRHVALTSTGHLAHVDLLGLPPELFQLEPDLGLGRDQRRETDLAAPASWLGEVGRQLTARGVDYDLADTHAASETLARYPLVCLQSTELLDPDDQVTLLDYVESGGYLVVGPTLPTLTPTLLPHPVLARFLDAPGTVEVGKGRLTWTPTAGVRELVDAAGPRPAFRVAGPPVETTELRRGEERLVFLANPTAEAVDTRLCLDGAWTLDDAWSDRPQIDATGELPLTVAPYRVEIFSATRAGGGR